MKERQNHYHVTSGQKHMAYLLLCMPVVGDPGMAVNTFPLEP